MSPSIRQRLKDYRLVATNQETGALWYVHTDHYHKNKLGAFRTKHKFIKVSGDYSVILAEGDGAGGNSKKGWQVEV